MPVRHQLNNQSSEFKIFCPIHTANTCFVFQSKETGGLTQEKVESESEVKVAQPCPALCDPMDYTYSPWNSPSQNTGVGSLSLLQGVNW